MLCICTTIVVVFSEELWPQRIAYLLLPPRMPRQPTCGLNSAPSRPSWMMFSGNSLYSSRGWIHYIQLLAPASWMMPPRSPPVSLPWSIHWTPGQQSGQRTADGVLFHFSLRMTTRASSLFQTSMLRWRHFKNLAWRSNLRLRAPHVTLRRNSLQWPSHPSRACSQMLDVCLTLRSRAKLPSTSRESGAPLPCLQKDVCSVFSDIHLQVILLLSFIHCISLILYL